MALEGPAGDFQAPGGGTSKEGPVGGVEPRQLATQSEGSCKRHLEPAGFQQVPGLDQPQLPAPPLPPSSQLSQLSSNVADGPTIIFETPLSAKVHSPPPPGSPSLTLVAPQLLCPFFDPLFFSNLVASPRPTPRLGPPHPQNRAAIPLLPDRRPTPERPQPAPQPCPTRVIGMRQLPCLLHVHGGGHDMGGNHQPPRPSPAPGTAMPRRRPSPCDTRTWCHSQRLLLTLPHPAPTDGQNPPSPSSDANLPSPSPPPTTTRLPTMVPTRPMPPRRSA